MILIAAFQMAVDNDVLHKNPFGFELAGVVVNDSGTNCESSLNLLMMIMYTVSIMKLCIYFFIQVCVFQNFAALQLKMLI